MAYIRYDPDKPGDRARAYGEYFLGFVALWSFVGGIIFYVVSLVHLFKGKISVNILYAFGIYCIGCVLAFFALNIGNHNKKERIGKYATVVVFGLLDASALIGIIVSAASLYNGEGGLTILIVSGIAFIALTAVFVVLYHHFNQKNWMSTAARNNAGSISNEVATVVPQISTANLTESQTREIKPAEAYLTKQTGAVIFCHKCGKKLPDDSEFCSSCGAKMK